MSAILSPCGAYRYRLEREVAGQGPVFAFFGVNPSTADATADDATVRKWTGFVKRWGGSRFIVGNVFAYRATDVRDLTNDPGPAFSLDNQGHLKAIAAAADVLVPCWGNRSKVPLELHHHFDNVAHLLWQTGKPVRVFGLTGSGDPKHPLMLDYNTPLVDWPSGANQIDHSNPRYGVIEEADAAIAARHPPEPNYLDPTQAPLFGAAGVKTPILDVTLTKDEAECIVAFIADENVTGDEVVRLMVGDGHAGYGLYAAHPDYSDEGAILVKNILAPAGGKEGGHAV